jgi:hypothetical protein
LPLERIGDLYESPAFSLTSPLCRVLARLLDAQPPSPPLHLLLQHFSSVRRPAIAIAIAALLLLLLLVKHHHLGPDIPPSLLSSPLLASGLCLVLPPSPSLSLSLSLKEAPIHSSVSIPFFLLLPVPLCPFRLFSCFLSGPFHNLSLTYKDTYLPIISSLPTLFNIPIASHQQSNQSLPQHFLTLS